MKKLPEETSEEYTLRCKAHFIALREVSTRRSKHHAKKPRPKKHAKHINSKMPPDWERKILAYALTKTSLTVFAILKDCLGLSAWEMSNKHTMRVVDVLEANRFVEISKGIWRGSAVSSTYLLRNALY